MLKMAKLVGFVLVFWCARPPPLPFKFPSTSTSNGSALDTVKILYYSHINNTFFNLSNSAESGPFPDASGGDRQPPLFLSTS